MGFTKMTNRLIEEKDIQYLVQSPAKSLVHSDYLLAHQAERHLVQTFNMFANEMERRVYNVEASVAELSAQLGAGQRMRSAFRGAMLAFPPLPQCQQLYQQEHQSRHHQSQEMVRHQRQGIVPVDT